MKKQNKLLPTLRSKRHERKIINEILGVKEITKELCQRSKRAEKIEEEKILISRNLKKEITIEK